MRDPAWINVTPSVPIVADFGSTRGMGSPICIDNTTNQPYYLKNNIVTLLIGGFSGSYTGNVTITGNLSVTDDPYAASWNSSTDIPTKNAIFDKIGTFDHTLFGGL